MSGSARPATQDEKAATIKRRVRHANWRRGKGESPPKRMMTRSTIHREPFSGIREGAGAASGAARVSRVLSLESDMVRSVEASLVVEGNIGCAFGEAYSDIAASETPGTDVHPTPGLARSSGCSIGQSVDRIGKADSRSR